MGFFFKGKKQGYAKGTLELQKEKEEGAEEGGGERVGFIEREEVGMIDDW